MEKKVEKKPEALPKEKQYVFATSGTYNNPRGGSLEYKKGEPVKGFSLSSYKHLLVNGIIKEK